MDVSDDGRWTDGRWSTVDAERVALRGCSTAPWMYRAMVGGAMVTDRCSAAWRWALSEFEEKTFPCLIQTGGSFSSNLKHGPMVGDRRSLRRTDIIDVDGHC